MSSCLSAGGRTYALDLEIIKSSSTSTRNSQTSSSPSSTLSESSNSPLAISTRKPRTPRKRPNQTYNEAAALLSTAYPNIFSTKNLTKPCKFTKAPDSFFHESSELLLPFRVIDDCGFLLHNQPIREKPSCLIEPKVVNFVDRSWQSTSGEVNSHGGGGSLDMEFSTEFQEDFDAESILDEEIEEGIDSIMGNLSVDQDTLDESNNACQSAQFTQTGSWYGNPMAMGLGFGGKFDFGLGLGGLRRGVRALRHVDEGNWWNFPTVDVLQISPKTNTKAATAITTTTPPGRAEKKKKKKKKAEKPNVVTEAKSSETPKENPNPRLQLKLNYDEVVNAWSGRGFPFSEESPPGSEGPGNDFHARLAQIDLFSEGGGVREASVLRYKEKRRSRLFAKKIRYQVRKVNADRRPRMKD